MAVLLRVVKLNSLYWKLLSLPETIEAAMMPESFKNPPNLLNWMIRMPAIPL